MMFRVNWLMYSIVVVIGRKTDPGNNLQIEGENWQYERRKVALGEQDQKGSDPESKDQFFSLAQTVITELKLLIWTAGINKQDKSDLLLSLLQLLKTYTALTVLQAYPFRIAINNFIVKETAIRCSIHLNNEELLALWREVR